MASINYAAREISVKVVFYGPGLSGKTTNLQVIHRKIPAENRSDMVSLATETDRTLFFDFLPIDLGKIKGFSTKFQLYTVPGQVYYNATRKLVLRGVDGVVFVADSAPDKMDENLESFQNLEENLAEYGYQRESIPIIIQYNKRDLPNALSIPELQAAFNKYNLPFSEAVAARGIGVFESLKLIGKIVLDHLNKKYDRQPSAAARPQAAPVRPLPQQPLSAPPPPAMQSVPPVMPPPQQQFAQPRQQPFVQPQGAPANDAYMNYGTISLESMSSPAAAQMPQQPAAMAQPQVDFDNEIEQYQNHFSAQPARDDEHEIFEVNTSAHMPAAPLAQQPPAFSQQPQAYAQQQPAFQQPQSFAPQQQMQQQFAAQTQQFQQYQQTPHYQQQQPQFQQQQFQQQPQFQQQQFQQQQMPQQQQFQQFQQSPQFQQQQNYQQTAQFQTFQQPPQQQNNADANDYNVYNGQQAAPFQPPVQRPPQPQQPPQNNFDDTMYFTSVDTEKRHKTRKPINPKNQKKGLFSRMFNRNDPL